MTPTLRRALLSTLPLLPLAACDNPVSRHFEWQKHAAVVEFAGSSTFQMELRRSGSGAPSR